MAFQAPFTTSKGVVFVAAIVVLAALWFGLDWMFPADAAPIRVGILHSRSGPMAISENSMVDAELLAIDEINANGGLLGRKILPVIADGKSDWPTFAREAERLITQENVSVIFGCWTSASRKTVAPVIEKHGQLMIYPMAYEGLEQSPNIIYTGAAPNQQVIPAIKWSLDHIGRRIYLIGSDYVWPRSINEIMKDTIRALGAELVGEDYIFFGSSNVAKAVERIKAAQPDVVLSSVVGDSNRAFYQALTEAGLTATKLPVVSVSIGEEELRSLPIASLQGHYSAWSYFEAIKTPENARFVQNFRARYGANRVTGDVIATSYFSVRLWAKAVQEAQSLDVERVRRTMLTETLDAQEGLISVDPYTQHTWRSFSVGKIRPDGQIELVWTINHPIRPVPYPPTRTKAEWEAFLSAMFSRWGGSWANPVEAN
ncbi:urea ABC transporter substrate-binding protein [Methylocystis echinoides]|uniref:Urea ABC transporter substrate-binding protein n=1 Tax=Methylocystis echinoides TaxID=29468 RepID=A0A9W6GVE4_9HYPH|nr:urea ABC transporter substrate-binding protein [Methylocystis echinoides]GLI93776.1 urea ABC transporter substrate-binding protein [Methylocystis echinoides]